MRYIRAHIFSRASSLQSVSGILQADQFRGSPLLRLRSHKNILVLSDALSHSPESICHQPSHSNDVYGGSEAANGQVALVLDGAVAAGWRHILRHGGQLLFVAQWVRESAVDAET